MKNIFITIITAFVFLISNKAYSQLDTLTYLKQFEINKAQYIGQPFSKLLQDMTQIQPKTVWGNPPFNNRNIIQESRFKFCNIDYSFNNAIILRISWLDDISSSQVKYYQDKNHFYFTAEERSFYGNKIVKDIKVYRW